MIILHVYQSDHEIDSTYYKWWSNDKDHDDGVTMMMIKCLDLEKKKEKQKAQDKCDIHRSFLVW